MTAFQAAGFSGLAFCPVELFTTTETPIGRGVWELRVRGWGGMASTASGVRLLEECSSCKHQVFSGYTERSKLFREEAWDGSDFFVIWPLPRYIMVTQRVREHILGEGYSGVVVRSLAELPDVIAGTLTPGHFEDWFDEVALSRIHRKERTE